MTQIEIIQTLEFTKMELETCYKRLGYTSSNVLKSLDKTIEALSKAIIKSVCEHSWKYSNDGEVKYCTKCDEREWA